MPQRWMSSSPPNSILRVFVPFFLIPELPVSVTIGSNFSMSVIINTANLTAAEHFGRALVGERGTVSLETILFNPGLPPHYRFVELYNQLPSFLLNRTDVPPFTNFIIGSISTYDLQRIGLIYGIDAPEFIQLVNPPSHLVATWTPATTFNLNAPGPQQLNYGNYEEQDNREFDDDEDDDDEDADDENDLDDEDNDNDENQNADQELPQDLGRQVAQFDPPPPPPPAPPITHAFVMFQNPMHLMVRQDAIMVNDFEEEPLLLPGNRQRDAESAMEFLTEWQENTLKNLSQKYQAKNEAMGGDKGVIKNLQDFLSAQYILRNHEEKLKYRCYELPLTWDALQAMKVENNWLNEQYQAALKVYYKDPVHTLYRYFLEPNPWVSPSAYFVRRVESVIGGTAEFARYEDLIATMWLAASDPEQAIGEGRLSVLERQRNFVVIVAELNRTHNYDSGGTFHEDDGEGDKPSCHMGVRSRLFSSVPDHSMMRLDPKEYAEAEMARFFQRSYGNMLSTLTRDQFINFYELIIAGQDITIYSSDPEILLLQDLEISQGEKNYLKAAVFNQLERLDRTYRESIINEIDAAFTSYETKYKPRLPGFEQEEGTVNTAQHFYDYFITYNFEQILKQVAQTKGVNFDNQGNIVRPAATQANNANSARSSPVLTT